MTRRRREEIAALVLYTVGATVATWPLVLSPFRVIAGGLGDPLLNTTILAWDADRARHGFAGFWNAPFLFPHTHTLAYSEHLIGVALFTTPIDWLTGNPVLAYNVAYFGSYMLAGFGAFLLTRELWGRSDAAVLAGLAFATTPYRLAQTTHLQVLMHGWMPIGLWALHRYFATRRRGWLVGFVAAFALVGLSNSYYVYFFALPVAVVVAGGLAASNERGRILAELAVATLAVAVVFAPIGVIYYDLQRSRGFVRPFEELAGLSARLSDYFRVPVDGWTWGGLLSRGAQERELFHGFVLLAFAALGIGRSLARRSRNGIVYLIILALAFWLSLGPGAGRPYGLLFYLVPGVSGIRVVARLAVIVLLALTVLAGAGFAALLGRLSRRGGATAMAALAAVIVLEGQHGASLTEVPLDSAGRVRLQADTTYDAAWDHVAYDWLRRSPPGAALELNITMMDDFHPFTTMYQLHAVRHGHPIVNGYSGWKSVLQELLGAPTSPLREPSQVSDTLRGLQSIGVRYVLLHARTFQNPEEAARIESDIRASKELIADEQRFGDTWAWRLPEASDARTSPFVPGDRVDPVAFEIRSSHGADRLRRLVDGDPGTRWFTGEPQTGFEWIEVRLREDTDIERLTFETAPRSAVDYPRHLIVESTDASGSTRVLFDAGVVDRTIRALAIDEQRIVVPIDLPANRTRTLRIRQTGSSRAWWSIHELGVWRRKILRAREASARTPSSSR